MVASSLTAHECSMARAPRPMTDNAPPTSESDEVQAPPIIVYALVCDVWSRSDTFGAV
jgi:hypothetical protein